MRVLVLGAAGLLGNAMFRILGETTGWTTLGATRRPEAFPESLRGEVLRCGDLENPVAIAEVFDAARAEVVVNCLSIGRRELREENFAAVVQRLSVLPQRLAQQCRRVGARLIHFSSDGVFSGSRGNYSEDDFPDASDAYGIAKLLGELRDPHTVTIRTSMLGHELSGASGLLEWFLAQEARARCYRHAIFSGLPTCEIARIVREFVVPHRELSGVYHVAAAPISKFELLSLVAHTYGKAIDIEPDDGVRIDRSLNSDRFARATGYRAPGWPELVTAMHDDHARQRNEMA